MSSRKKLAKDRQAAAEGAAPAAAVRPERDWLLEGAAVVRANNISPAFSNARLMASGRPFGPLPHTTWQTKRDAWLDTAVTSINPAAADTPFTAATPETTQTHRTCQEAWAMDIAERLPSPVIYPHHSIGLALHPTVLPSAGAQGLVASTPATFVAAAIRRILAAHTMLMNARYASPDTAYQRLHDVEYLLGHALFSDGGYLGPEPESKDTTFHPSHSTVVQSSDGSRRLRLVSHQDATHVNVCVGPYYYQLTVVDSSTGAIFDVHKLAQGLEAISAHAAATCKAFDALTISVEDKAELASTRSLLARLSSVHDDVSADVRRRLRAVSEVNAYSLDQLEGGLLTVVLRLPGMPEGASAQWLHSCLSLYADWQYEEPSGADGAVSQPFPMVAHASALVADLQTLHEFITVAFREGPVNEMLTSAQALAEQAASMATQRASVHSSRTSVTGVPNTNSSANTNTPSQRPQSSSRRRSTHQQGSRGSSTATPPLPAPDGPGAAATTTTTVSVDPTQEEGCETADATAPVTVAQVAAAWPSISRHAQLDRCTALNVDASAVYLELWLPHTHRVPLMPAAPSLYVPSGQTIPLDSPCSLADFCLCVVLGAEATARVDGARQTPSTAIAAPRVDVTLLLPDRTAPLCCRLSGPELFRYMEVHRSASALITKDVRRHARRTARASVAALLDACARGECLDRGSAATNENPSGARGGFCSTSDDSKDTADVNISIALTTRATTTALQDRASHITLLESVTRTYTPATVQLHCSIIQERAEKSLTVSECLVRNRVETGASDPSDADTARLLVAHTVEEIEWSRMA